jgi:tetratricopeptide (TPR) repeat protein
MPYTPMQLAEAFIQTGELQDAVAALKEHLNAQPLDDSARRLLASVLMRLPGKENTEEAVRHLEVLRTAEDYVMLGLIKERSGEEYEPVIDEFYYAWRLDGNNERIGEMYIERLIQAGTQRHLGDALSTALGVILHMPRTWRWLKWAGDISVQMSAYSWAVMYYNEAIADLERQFDTQNNAFSANLKANLVLKRANTYLNLKELDAAEADYQLAETIVPGDVTITFQRGLLAFLRGNLDEAIRLCQTGLKAASETLSWHMRATLIQEQYAPLAALLDTPTS